VRYVGGREEPRNKHYVVSFAEAIYAGTGIGQTVLASHKHPTPARERWEASTASPKD